MAVEAFMPLNNIKQTTEKQVKPRLSIEELTTVESPGRPSPASMLEGSNRRKTTARKKTPAKAEARIIKPKGDAILIITEKPQAALKIASALGKIRKLTEEGVSYYEVERDGKKIIVASAVGHLFGLNYVPGQKGWPIFEIEWQPAYEKKSAAFTRRYYNTLKKLAQRAGEFIVATDFDIEGEVIGWNVLRFICHQKSAKRMKFSTLTPKELEAAFVNPLKELAWGNAYAGEARHILDWLYGINLSRALMSAIKTTGSFKLLSIGRVQGPALKVIVDREKEIMNFKPVPYFQVFALAKDIEFKHPKDIFNKEELEKFKGIKEAIAKTEKKEEKLTPPVPFDLTTLQREAYKFYKINPSETLAIAQKLYLEGIISYPRTSSQKIPDAIEPKKIIALLKRYFPQTAFATRQKPIEGKKEDPAHPSIYPTGEFKELEGRDKKLYELIVARFLSAFAEDAKLATKKITLDAKGIEFTANAQEIIEKGWLNIYPSKMEESTLPDLNGPVKIDKIRIDEKETQPPNRYSPASLVAILEKKNLGTKATRSSIVETLFDRGYLDGQSIKATPLGMQLIETLEKHSPIIIDENLTRTLEEEMEEIQLSHEQNENLENKEKEVIEKAKKIITVIAKEFKAKEKAIGKDLLKGLTNLRQEQNEAAMLMPCPTCKTGTLRIMFSRKTRRSFIGCSAYPACTQTFSLPPNSLIKKTEKVCEADNFPRLLAIRKGKKPWEFCFNPNCPIEKAKREEWLAKTNKNQE